jgi:hypothetical protein
MAYGSALDVRSCAKREGSWTFAQVSVQTYACECGPGMGLTAWRMSQHGMGELERRGRYVLVCSPLRKGWAVWL